MDRTSIKQNLQEILERSVNDTICAIDETMNLQADLNLDSMDVVTMAIEIESDFRIELKAPELVKLVLVKDLVDLIETKVSARRAQAA